MGVPRELLTAYGPPVPRLVVVALAVAASLVGLSLPASAVANPSIATGYGPSSATDRDGTTHLVWGIKPTENIDDQIGYCRIAPGTDTCQEAIRTFTLPADCHRGETDESYARRPAPGRPPEGPDLAVR